MLGRPEAFLLYFQARRSRAFSIGYPSYDIWALREVFAVQKPGGRRQAKFI
jgi:hypothetical protein